MAGTAAFQGRPWKAVFVAMLAMNFIVASFAPTTQASEPSTHAGISIRGNDGFTVGAGVTGGAGTVADPFIIEGWSIEVSGPAITIEDTTAYFVIRNVNLFYSSSGLRVMNSTNGLVENSTFSLNTFWAIEISGSRNIVLSGNVVSENTGGIGIVGSSNVTIRDNTVQRNGNRNTDIPTGINVGLRVNSTRIFHNRIIDNYGQAFDASGSYWDNDYPGGGNYWSDYKGADNCSGPSQTDCWTSTTVCANPTTAQGCTTENHPKPDGIGDVPYIISSNSIDHYPLVSTVQSAPTFYQQNWFVILLGVATAGVVLSGLLVLVRRGKRKQARLAEQGIPRSA